MQNFATHFMTRTALALCACAATASIAFAAETFQLPRECSERHNVDAQKCEVQDGPPRAPRVIRPADNVQSGTAPARTRTPTTTPIAPPRGTVRQ